MLMSVWLGMILFSAPWDVFKITGLTDYLLFMCIYKLSLKKNSNLTFPFIMAVGILHDHINHMSYGISSAILVFVSHYVNMQKQLIYNKPYLVRISAFACFLTLYNFLLFIILAFFEGVVASFHEIFYRSLGAVIFYSVLILVHVRIKKYIKRTKRLS